MCGITGVFTHEPEIPAHLNAVARMTDLMRRRGPDDEGHWTDRSHVALGFRRLSILDLSSAGHQPMESACRRYVLVFNGEVYNFRELREILERRGHRFRSTSDTEVVLQALIEWGESALSRFNGMFALAWYDSFERRLVLARDPLGIKPLYYLNKPRGVVFGSQYDQVVSHAYCDRRIQIECLGLFLRLGYLPPPYGLFADTHMLPPGCLLRVERQCEPVIFQYYSFPDESDAITAPEEAGAAVEEVLGPAVRRQMVSDVPLGAFLSGGVDSPLVAAEMARASDNVQTFTIGCAEPRFDESEAARAYAAALGLRHHVDTVSADACLELISEGARAFSEPFADFSSLPTLLLCRGTSRHMKVALSGDGGDELFWGYPRFRKIGSCAQWFRRPRAVRALAFAASRGLRRGDLPRGLLFPSAGEWQFDGHSFSGLRTADLRRLSPGLDRLPVDFRLYQSPKAGDRDSLLRWLRQNELWGHLQMVLLKVDRASMHYSLEVRVPLLDLKVVELAARTAPEACLSNNLGKLPLRRALAEHVPPERIPERKSGFTIPLDDWLRGKLKPLVEDLLLAPDTYPGGWLEPRELRSLWDEHLGGEDRSRSLWHLLSLQLWAREHLGSHFALKRGRDPEFSRERRLVECA